MVDGEVFEARGRMIPTHSPRNHFAASIAKSQVGLSAAIPNIGMVVDVGIRIALTQPTR